MLKSPRMYACLKALVWISCLSPPIDCIPSYDDFQVTDLIATEQEREAHVAYQNLGPIGVPLHYDIRLHHPACTDIINTDVNQGRCFSCAAMMLASTIQDRACIVEAGMFTPSPVDVVANAPTVRREVPPCNRQLRLNDIMYYYRDFGIVSGSLRNNDIRGCAPYNDTGMRPVLDSCTNPAYAVAYTDDKKKGAYRFEEVNERFILCAEMMWGQGTLMMQIDQTNLVNWKPGDEPVDCKRQKGNHMIKIIGYDMRDANSSKWTILGRTSYGNEMFSNGDFVLNMQGCMPQWCILPLQPTSSGYEAATVKHRYYKVTQNRATLVCVSEKPIPKCTGARKTHPFKRIAIYTCVDIESDEGKFIEWENRKGNSLKPPTGPNVIQIQLKIKANVLCPRD